MMDNTEKMARMILKAIERHGRISRCGQALTLLDCFTTDADDQLVLWYNSGVNTYAIREVEICTQ